MVVVGSKRRNIERCTTRRTIKEQCGHVTVAYLSFSPTTHVLLASLNVTDLVTIAPRYTTDKIHFKADTEAHMEVRECHDIACDMENMAGTSCVHYISNIRISTQSMEAETKEKLKGLR